MTTEDDFQAALDADPSDWMTRLVFADWLEEQGDPRADGYRALGLLRRRHARFDGRSVQYSCEPAWHEMVARDPHKIPADWLAEYSAIIGRCRVTSYRFAGGVQVVAATRRRALDDSVAHAFARLPAARRAELLALAPVGA